MIFAGQGDGAGAIGRHQRFHIMAGRGAHELAAFLGEQIGDGAGIISLQRFAGQDNGAGVDVLRCQLGFLECASEKFLQLIGVDRVIGAVRRQQNG